MRGHLHLLEPARPLRQARPGLPPLALAFWRAVLAFSEQASDLADIIQPWAQRGEALLQQSLREWQTEGHDITLAHVLPVRLTQDDPEFVPMHWLPLELIDPCNIEQPTDLDRRLIRLLALLRQVPGYWGPMTDLLADRQQVSLELVYQLWNQLDDGAFESRQTGADLQEVIEEAEALEAATAEQRAAQAQALADAEANMVVFGDTHIPAQHGKVGHLADGRQAAVSMSRGHSVLSIGPPGKGKSYLNVLLMEMLLLHLVGLNRLVRPGASVVFAGDWRKGQTRHQHLCGLDPNPNAAHWQYLRQWFSSHLSPFMGSYRKIVCFVLPDTKHIYEKMYPDLIERGLEFHEIELDQSEWGNFGYQAMLSHLGDRSARGKAISLSLIDSIVGDMGIKAHPERVLKELERVWSGGGLPALRGYLKFMSRLTSKREKKLGGIMKEGAMVVFLLESQHMAPEMILPLQVAIMNILAKAAPEGMVYLIGLEEVAKMAGNPVVLALLDQVFREVRHALGITYAGLHDCTDLPGPMVSRATGVAVFGGTSLEHHTKLRGLRREFHPVMWDEVKDLPTGTCAFGWNESSDPACAQRAQIVTLRPSCVYAGGETLTVQLASPDLLRPM